MPNRTWVDSNRAAAAVSLVVLATSVALVANSRSATSPTPDPEARIAALEERIQLLERQLDRLKDAVGRVENTDADPQGSNAAPARLKTPVEVFDDSGQVILRIQRGPAGGGVVQALDASGGTAALLGPSIGGAAGAVRLYKSGKELVTVGVAGDEGVVRLSDPAGRIRLSLGAEVNGGGLAMYDASGNERVRLGFADGNRGYVAVRNDKGTEVAHLFESAAGVGNLVTRDGDGQGVQIGTKTRASGAFGDVCATSPKGGMCLSVLAIKTMNPVLARIRQDHISMTKESPMRRRIASWGGLLLAVCVVATPGAQLPSMDPATEQAIRSYRLDRGNTEVILKTLKEVSAAVMKDPDWMTKIQSRMKLTLEQQCAAMESDPATGPILQANRISAKDYSFGLLALRAAALADAGIGVAKLANPANVAFLKANPSIVERLNAIDMGK